MAGMATIAAAVLASSARRLIFKRWDDVIGVLSRDSCVFGRRLPSWSMFVFLRTEKYRQFADLAARTL
jgi:hypothetical protein